MENLVLHYPNKLLKIETRQQFKQLSLFDENGNLKSEFAENINKSIDKILHLNEKDGKYSIEFPNDIDKILPDDIKSKVTKELTAAEVRVLTAVVGMVQRAKMEGSLKFYEEIERAYFTFNLSDLYESAGAKKNSGKYNPKQKEQIREALLSLHKKEFIVPNRYYDNKKKNWVQRISIFPLLQIHEVEQLENFANTKKGVKFKITVADFFIGYEKEKRQNYFNIPSDLNQRLRRITRGRPNAGVELFLKYLYQAVHCSKNDTIEYNYNSLVDIMRLDKYIANNNHKRIRPAIEKAFEAAIKLGIIKTWLETKNKWGSVKFVLEVNK